LFKPKDAPTYAPGFIAVLATSTAAALLAIAYRFLCIRENCHRDRSDTQEYPVHAHDDLGDGQKPDFRYVF
jgi:hypothetical protein